MNTLLFRRYINEPWQILHPDSEPAGIRERIGFRSVAFVLDGSPGVYAQASGFTLVTNDSRGLPHHHAFTQPATAQRVLLNEWVKGRTFARCSAHDSDDHRPAHAITLDALIDYFAEHGTPLEEPAPAVACADCGGPCAGPGCPECAPAL